MIDASKGSMLQGDPKASEGLEVPDITSLSHFVFKGPCLYQARLHSHLIGRSDCFGSIAVVFNAAGQLCFEVVEVFPLAYIN